MRCVWRQGVKRYPLTIALSEDEGETWRYVRDIGESLPRLCPIVYLVVATKRARAAFLSGMYLPGNRYTPTRIPRL
eukprot:6256160-Pyramimonas_sp.AAC.1